MKNEITNRVAKSSLMIFDLEDYFLNEPIYFIDIKQWLYNEQILKEKEFREHLRIYQWQQYQGAWVALGCTSEAIIPAWAYILVTSYLLPYAQKVVQGDRQQLLYLYYEKVLSNVDFEQFRDKPVILKGCSKKDIPQSVYVLAITYLQSYAKQIMYGEACSAVPIYKK